MEGEDRRCLAWYSPSVSPWSLAATTPRRSNESVCPRERAGPTLPPLPVTSAPALRTAQGPRPPVDLRRRPDYVLPEDPAAERPPGADFEDTNPAPIRPRPEPAGPATPPLAPWTAPSPPVVPPTDEPTMAIPPSRPGEEEMLHRPGSPTPPSPTGPPGPLSLAEFERMALERNPTLRAAAGIVNISRGRAWQAGLWPNPFIGYIQTVINLEGTAGEFQGARFQQEIPAANKRRLSRRKYEWEAETANWLAIGQQMRVLNGVRIRYMEYLAHQRLLDYRALLYKIADAGLRTTEEMANVGQANRPDLLAAQIQQQQARIDLIHARNQLRRAWINLITVAGAPELRDQMRRLEGPLEADAPLLDYDQSLNAILTYNPQLKAAVAEIRRDEVTVMREKVEPIPNTLIRGDVGYNWTSAAAGRQCAGRLEPARLEQEPGDDPRSPVRSVPLPGQC